MVLTPDQMQGYGEQFADEVIQRYSFLQTGTPDMQTELKTFLVNTLQRNACKEDLIDVASDPRKKGMLDDRIQSLMDKCEERSQSIGRIAHMANYVDLTEGIVMHHIAIRNELGKAVEEFCAKYKIAVGRKR